jgi:hypothetical protein
VFEHVFSKQFWSMFLHASISGPAQKVMMVGEKVRRAKALDVSGCKSRELVPSTRWQSKSVDSQ